MSPFDPFRGGGRQKGTMSPFFTVFFTEERPLAELAKQIFGKSWEFGPTGLTPAPLPIRWDSQKGKKK